MKKLSALECASVEEAAGDSTRKDLPGSEHTPCVLLDPHAPLPAQVPSIDPIAPDSPAVEDESADPVGDGHSDADLAADLPPEKVPPQPREGSSKG